MNSKEIIEQMQKFPVTDGDHAGELFECLPWQRRFIRNTFRADGSIKVSSISVGRGNGKSTFCSFIACAYLTHGKRYNCDLVIVAASFEQAKIIFQTVLNTLKAVASPEIIKEKLRVIDSTNNASITNRETGLRVKVIGNDPDKAHGIKAVLFLCDEPAKWPGGGRKMWAAIKTSQGKIPNNKIILLGTSADSDSHFFTNLLHGNKKGHYSQLHAVPPDYDERGISLYSKRAYKMANPSVDHLPNLLEEIRDESVEAKADLNALYQFKALRLNMGTSEVETRHYLVSLDEWRACEVEQTERKGQLTVGLDLSGGAALSAACAYWNLSGALEGFAMFPSIPDLTERGKADHVGSLYQEMYDTGELITCYGRAVDIDLILLEVRRRWGDNITQIVADRFAANALFDALNRTGYSPDRTKFVQTGLGYREGGPAVIATQRAIWKRKLQVTKSLLFRAALAETRLIFDPAGNCKLAKNCDGGRRLRGRDDPILAATLAIHHGENLLARSNTTPIRFGLTSDV